MPKDGKLAHGIYSPRHAQRDIIVTEYLFTAALHQVSFYDKA